MTISQVSEQLGLVKNDVKGHAAFEHLDEVGINLLGKDGQRRCRAGQATAKTLQAQEVARYLPEHIPAAAACVELVSTRQKSGRHTQRLGQALKHETDLFRAALGARDGCRFHLSLRSDKYRPNLSTSDRPP